MTIRVRIGLTLIAALATWGLSGCDHYVCGPTFGSSTCASGTVSLSGGGGGSAAAAYVYLINGSASPGSLVSYTLNTASTPPAFSFTSNYTPPTTPSADAGMGLALAQGKFLYAAFGSTQQIYGWSLGTTGSLTPVPNSPLTQGLITQFNATEFDTQRLITNPAGTLLFIADQFTPEVFVYQIGSDGSLSAVANSPFSVAFPAGNMTTDGLGKYLYFTDSSGHTGTQIAAYSIGTGTGSAAGALTPVAGSPFAGTNFNMWQVEGEPTGQFLIGTTGVDSSVDDNLYVFSISSSTGALSTPVLYPTTNPPVNVAVQTNTGGNLIYTLGLNSAGTGFNPVEGYQLTAGVLSKVSGSPFAAAGVGDTAKFDQSGGLLFVYGGLFNTKTVVYTLTALDVSSGNLTTPTPMEAYGGYWVGADAP